MLLNKQSSKNPQDKKRDWDGKQVKWSLPHECHFIKLTLSIKVTDQSLLGGWWWSDQSMLSWYERESFDQMEVMCHCVLLSQHNLGSICLQMPWCILFRGVSGLKFRIWKWPVYSHCIPGTMICTQILWSVSVEVPGTREPGNRHKTLDFRSSGT